MQILGTPRHLAMQWPSLLVVVAAAFLGSGLAMTENERLDEYTRRHLHWPPAWHPPTKGWQALMERREKQIMSLASSQARWDGWTVMVGSASLVKNFTEKGYAVVKAPDSVNEKLQASLHKHKASARFEDTPSRQIDVIKGELRPKFIDQEELNREVLLELQPMFEEWSGVKLKPAIAYGLRLYQNGSSLLMHVDKIEDHVISAILHVGHEYDDEDEPWPIVIESFDGSTAAVTLEAGEMLFYESAKCMHGRPQPLKGKYYSSIFIHYLPVDWTLTGRDSQYNVPPHWLDGLEEAEARQGRPEDHTIPRLQIVGTGFDEPDCPDGWCNMPTRASFKGGGLNHHHHHHSWAKDDHLAGGGGASATAGAAAGAGTGAGTEGSAGATAGAGAADDTSGAAGAADDVAAATDAEMAAKNVAAEGTPATREDDSRAENDHRSDHNDPARGLLTASGEKVPGEVEGERRAGAGAGAGEGEGERAQGVGVRGGVGGRRGIGDMGKKLRGGLQAASAIASVKVRNAATAAAREAARHRRASTNSGDSGGDGGYGDGLGMGAFLTSFFVAVGPDGSVLRPLRYELIGPAFVLALVVLGYLIAARRRRRSGLKKF